MTATTQTHAQAQVAAAATMLNTLVNNDEAVYQELRELTRTRDRWEVARYLPDFLSDTFETEIHDGSWNSGVVADSCYNFLVRNMDWLALADELHGLVGED